MWQPQASAGIPSTVSIGRGKAPRWSRLQRTPSSRSSTRSWDAVAAQHLGVQPGSPRAARRPISDDEHARGDRGRAGRRRAGRRRRRRRASARPSVTYSKRTTVTTGLEADRGQRADGGDQHGDHALARRVHEPHRRHRRHHRQHGGDDAGHHGGARAQVVLVEQRAPATPEGQGQRAEDDGRPPVRAASAQAYAVATVTAPTPSSHGGPAGTSAATSAASPPATTSSHRADEQPVPDRARRRGRPSSAPGGAGAIAGRLASRAPDRAQASRPARARRRRSADPLVARRASSRGGPWTRRGRLQSSGEASVGERGVGTPGLAPAPLRSSVAVSDLGALAGLGQDVAERVHDQRVAGVARPGLAGRDHEDGVLDRPGPHERAPVLDLARAGHPGRGDDEHLGARGRRAAGPARGSAGRSRSSARPGSPPTSTTTGSSGPAVQRGRTRGSRRSRRGGSCGTTRSAAPRTSRVLKGRAGSSAVSNIPATTVVSCSAATAASSVANGPSSASAYGLTSEPASPKSRAKASGSTTRSAVGRAPGRAAARGCRPGRAPDAAWTTVTDSMVMGQRASPAGIRRCGRDWWPWPIGVPGVQRGGPGRRRRRPAGRCRQGVDRAARPHAARPGRWTP